MTRIAYTVAEFAELGLDPKRLYYSVREAMELLGWTREQVNRRLPMTRVRSSLFIHIDDLAYELANPTPPPPRGSVVYRFFDELGALLYVGKTVQGPQRWLWHMVNQPWWLEVATITVAHYETDEQAIAAEAKAIIEEQPRYNVAGKPR